MYYDLCYHSSVCSFAIGIKYWRGFSPDEFIPIERHNLNTILPHDYLLITLITSLVVEPAGSISDYIIFQTFYFSKLM